MANLNSNSVSGISCIHHSSTSIRCCALGSCIEGGNLIAKEGGSVLIMSPAPSGYCGGGSGGRSTAISCALACAQAAFACGDWFIPSLRDMLCASDAHQCGFWSGGLGEHWIDLACSAPPSSTNCACIVFIGTPTSGVCQGRHFGYSRYNNFIMARAARRVFY